MTEPSGPSQTHRPYKEGNIDEDGNYLVGKGRTPEGTRFRKGDGRKRGRRPKGTKNLRTDFEKEMAAVVTVSMNGKPRKVSRQRAIVMRLADNASRGQNTAIQMIFRLQEKFENRETAAVQNERAGNIDTPPENSDLDFDRLTFDEQEELDRLISKASGTPYEPRTDPLARCFDPSNEKNYYTERTVEGLHYRHCTIPGAKSELTRMENSAYRATALPKRQKFNRICN